MSFAVMIMTRILYICTSTWKLLGTGLAVAAVVFVVSSKALRGFYDHTYQVPSILFTLSSCVALVLAKYVARGCKPRFAEWTLEAEMAQGILRCIYSKRWRKSPRVERCHSTRGQCVNPVLHLDHIWLRTKYSDTIKKKHRAVVLYLHGGGFLLGCPAACIMTGYMQQSRAPHATTRLRR
jgi:hypothetical protein